MLSVNDSSDGPFAKQQGLRNPQSKGRKRRVLGAVVAKCLHKNSPGAEGMSTHRRGIDRIN